MPRCSASDRSRRGSGVPGSRDRYIFNARGFLNRLERDAELLGCFLATFDAASHQLTNFYDACGALKLPAVDITASHALKAFLLAFWCRGCSAAPSPGFRGSRYLFRGR